MNIKRTIIHGALLGLTSWASYSANQAAQQYGESPILDEMVEYRIQKRKAETCLRDAEDLPLSEMVRVRGDCISQLTEANAKIANNFFEYNRERDLRDTANNSSFFWGSLAIYAFFNTLGSLFDRRKEVLKNAGKN